MLGAFNWIGHLYHNHHVAKRSADKYSHRSLQHDLVQLKGADSVEELKNKLDEID